MSDIEEVINELCEQFPEFKLFFDSRFEIRKRSSLIPIFASNLDVSFDESIEIVRKDLTLTELKKYYEEDLRLWLEMLIEKSIKGTQ